jgi:hypothetical protein
MSSPPCANRLVRAAPPQSGRHANPPAVNQALLPLQQLACARPRSRPARRHWPRPFQPARPCGADQRASPRLCRQPLPFRPYRLPSRARRALRPFRGSGHPGATNGPWPIVTPRRCSTAFPKAGQSSATGSGWRPPGVPSPIATWSFSSISVSRSTRPDTAGRYRPVRASDG